VAKEKKTFLLVIAAILVFVLYVFAAAQPVPKETVFRNNWLKPLSSSFAAEEKSAAAGPLVPFTLGGRFGYTDAKGVLALNKVKEHYVSISEEYWSEYESAPESIVIEKPAGGGLTLSPATGYPVFMDGRIFIISKDQTALSEIAQDGAVLWSYDFAAPITTMDAAGGHVLVGGLDGIVDLIGPDGKPVFPSYAPASRITVILGCRLSKDASKLALVAGIDKQRFIFLERYSASGASSGDYRVTKHEFLKGDGFRREVHMAFIDNDSRVIFEQEEGLGIYDVKERTLAALPVSGKIEAIDTSGGDGLFFFVTSNGDTKKRFIALGLTGKELVNVPFTAENVFLSRRGRELYLGGGMTLASFTLDKM
jgi:hypothetical protein